MTPSQIRQDLSCFGCFGQQGSGYEIVPLKQHLESIMGLSDLLPIILVGAGSLGKVVSENVAFAERGFRLVGIFDIKPELIGKTMADLEIHPAEEIPAFCKEYHPTAAVLCLPKEAAQTAAEQLVSLGICGIWNFSHCDIAVEQAQVVTVHLDDSLMTLSYGLHNNK
jgi:redox-sensing transcriptional repressor